MIVVDAVTGRLFRRMPFAMLVTGNPILNAEPYSFRSDSRLLIVEGYFDEKAEYSRRYYDWTGSSFRLLRKIRLKPALQP